MILLIDNYDSFTWNLAQYFGQLGVLPVVRRNDEITLDEVAALRPERIVISPGPGRPESAGISVELVRRFGPQTPILGVCLGHQAIGQAFGAEILRAPQLMHGKTSSVAHDGKGVFRNLSQPFTAGRYHSLVVSGSLPEELEATAHSEDGTLMGLRHKRLPIHGVQFHPESVLTDEGHHLLRNFLELAL